MTLGSAFFAAGALAVALAGCSSKPQADTNNSIQPSTSEKSAADWRSKLDPQMKEVIDQLGSMGGKPIETLSPEEARKQPSPADAVKALMQKKGMSSEPEPVGKVENRKIGQNPVRIYWPKEGKAPYPIVVYYHGGGWVIADLDTYDSTPRAIANKAGAVVISAEYRHAPENKLPAAHEDAYAAYKWAIANASSLKGNPKKIAVMGESAGGNLATGVAMMAKDKKDPLPIYQVLVYPVAQYGDFETESYKDNADAKPLNKAMMEWFWKNALASPADGEKEFASPLKASDLKGLPAATVITAEIDPLRSEGKAYADKLKDAGVNVEYQNYDGVTHEFFGMGSVVEKAKAAEEKAASGLRSAFEK